MGIEQRCSFNNFADSVELVEVDAYGNANREPLLRIWAEAGHYRMDLPVSRLLEELLNAFPEEVESAVASRKAQNSGTEREPGEDA